MAPVKHSACPCCLVCTTHLMCVTCTAVADLLLQMSVAPPTRVKGATTVHAHAVHKVAVQSACSMQPEARKEQSGLIVWLNYYTRYLQGFHMPAFGPNDMPTANANKFPTTSAPNEQSKSTAPPSFPPADTLCLQRTLCRPKQMQTTATGQHCLAGAWRQASLDTAQA